MSQNIFLNPFVLSPPTLTGGSVGNGTLTIDKLTHFTINQQYTAVCTATSPFTVFNIIGLLDGAVGVAVVGTQFNDEDLKIFLTIQQGPTLFAIGDVFNFEVAQGTDVTQQNLDSYDELPQKNFGAGQTGQNKGDHNIRFNLSPTPASKIIGDLQFNALLNGPSGNEISIEYIAGSLLAAANRTIQSLYYEANIPGSAGNNIQIQYEDYTPAIQAMRIIQDIEFAADVYGANGNLISIQYTSGGTAGAEIVTVLGNAITVQIQSGVSTANQIMIALGLSGPASALVDFVGTGTGLETQITQSALFLTGGADAIGSAGNEIVTVIANLIKVKMQSGVSTAQNIYDKLILSVPALSLMTPTITGVPASVQTGPLGPLNLENGTENVGDPGNEIVTVALKAIKVTFVNGLSTATQIRNKILATPAAIALISVALTGLGSELQSSPIVQTYLTGGSDTGTYAFNEEELTNPGNFFEGNASILIKDIVNQGNDFTSGETLKKGKVTLDDDVVLNLPGPIVEHTQQTINNLIQNGKCFLVSALDAKTEWSKPAGTLILNGDLVLVFAETNIKNTLLNTSGPFTLADGEHIYFVVDRFNNINVTPIQSTTVPNSPNGENIFRLVSRVGTTLYWWDNTAQREGKKIRIGEGGSSGAWQEKLGIGNGANLNFPILSGLFPIAQESILVFSNTTHFVNDEWTYNVLQNQIEFVTAPAAGVEVYIYFLTDGDSIVVPSPSGVQQFIYHTFTPTEVTNKYLTLPVTPAVPAKTLVDYIGGGSQVFGLDFSITGLIFDWNGLGLDGLVVAGDIIRIVYQA
jgi:hypothetical protein